MYGVPKDLLGLLEGRQDQGFLQCKNPTGLLFYMTV